METIITPITFYLKTTYEIISTGVDSSKPNQIVFSIDIAEQELLTEEEYSQQIANGLIQQPESITNVSRFS